MLPISLADLDMLKYSPARFGSEDYLKDFFKNAFHQSNRGLRYPFAIYDKKDKQYVGSTSYGNISKKDLRLEIGWTWLGTKYQRTGINRHSKFLLLQYAFETLKFERVEFKTDSRNKQSRRSLESIGAKYEGELRSHTLLPDGARRDTVFYSILLSEWPEIKRTVFSKF
ncbi:MAG: GNAT family N-acetyltransferase [Thalassobius sp.]|nr:GNAT family N-acetyltransferase [Thalassovita sp.]